jgi:GAF domain-containing protein
MGTLQDMLATGEPLLIPDVSTDPRWTVDPQTCWIQSYAGVPMKVKDQIIGFLNLDSELPGSFTEETLQRLQAFASHAAAAIHHAVLKNWTG